MNKPLVYVLIINWNGREHLHACFSTLLESDYPNARFLLIDNASDDGSVAYVQEHFGQDERVAYLACQQNHGWSGGNNLGIQRALQEGADYVFLLNNDIAIAPDAISELVALAEATPDCGCLAPKMLLYDTPSVLNSLGLYCSIVGAAWDRGIGRADTPKWDIPLPVIGVCGGAMFIRAKVFDTVGLLPEDFVIYLDDLDLCLRIWSFGYNIQTCPKAVIRHKFSASMGQGKQIQRKYYLNTRNRFRLMLRNFPLRRWPRAAFWVLIGEVRAIGRAYLEGEYWRMSIHASAWFSALYLLPGALRYRIQQYRRGARPARFWSHIKTDRLFCPAVQLPKTGWYAPRNYHVLCRDELVRKLKLLPMAPAAALRIPLNKHLRIIHANCYPELGETQVEVWLNDTHLVTWETLSTQEIYTAELLKAIPSGEVTLHLRAQRLFHVEDTGESMDIGGWFTIEVLDKS